MGPKFWKVLRYCSWSLFGDFENWAYACTWSYVDLWSLVNFTLTRLISGSHLELLYDWFPAVILNCFHPCSAGVAGRDLRIRSGRRRHYVAGQQVRHGRRESDTTRGRREAREGSCLTFLCCWDGGVKKVTCGLRKTAIQCTNERSSRKRSPTLQPHVASLSAARAVASRRAQHSFQVSRNVFDALILPRFLAAEAELKLAVVLLSATSSSDDFGECPHWFQGRLWMGHLTRIKAQGLCFPLFVGVQRSIHGNQCQNRTECRPCIYGYSSVRICFVDIKSPPMTQGNANSSVAFPSLLNQFCPFIHVTGILSERKNWILCRTQCCPCERKIRCACTWSWSSASVVLQRLEVSENAKPERTSV